MPYLSNQMGIFAFKVVHTHGENRRANTNNNLPLYFNKYDKTIHPKGSTILSKKITINPKTD